MYILFPLEKDNKIKNPKVLGKKDVRLVESRFGEAYPNRVSSHFPRNFGSSYKIFLHIMKVKNIFLIKDHNRSPPIVLNLK